MRTDTGKRRGVALPHVYASWFVPADDLLLHQERAVSALLTPFCCSPRYRLHLHSPDHSPQYHQYHQYGRVGSKGVCVHEVRPKMTTFIYIHDTT